MATPAPRRSRRIAASRDGSRAGSVVSDTSDAQPDAVISAFAVREEGLRDQLASQRSQLSTQESQIEQLIRERDEVKRKYEQKRTLRESLFYERVQKQSERNKQEQQQTSHTPAPSASSPAAISQDTPAASATPKQQCTMEPETSTALVVATPSEHALETPRSSFFGRIFKTITSPFSARRSSETSPPQSSQEQRPLGELPSSRKRPAPEPEIPIETKTKPEEPRPKPRSTPQRKTTSGPSQSRAQTPYQPVALEPISEKAESEQRATTNMADPTPSRPPRSIAKIRRAARHSNSTPASKTPSRAWTRQPAPKEPNADARLEKLRRFQEAKETYQSMQEDEEIRAMVPRPTKRVKIDDLVAIPHNRPGDSESTFRVYDVDSDDEMEVDAEFAEIRQNIFEASKTNDDDEKKDEAQGPAHVTPQVAQQEEELKLPPKTFDFPNVGLLPEDERERPYDEYLAKKFAFGMAEWQRTGKLIEW